MSWDIIWKLIVAGALIDIALQLRQLNRVAFRFLFDIAYMLGGSDPKRYGGGSYDKFKGLS